MNRTRGLFWRVPPEREVDDEIAAHLELQAHRYARTGLSPDDARDAALRRFGDVERVRAECREIRQAMEARMRLIELLQEIRHDLVVAARAFAKQPLFTGVALLTLAIGIGANTAVFSVVDAVLLRALPYRYAARTVTIWNSYGAKGLDEAAVAPPELADIVEQTRAFDGVAAMSTQPSSIADDATGEPERVAAYVVSPHLFELLGTSPALGRGFALDDGQAGAARVVVLSHALWRRRFGGDPHVVGRTVNIGGQPRTIVGVMPAEVRFPDAPLGFLRERGDLWVPYDWSRSRGEGRGSQYLGVVARLRPGLPVAAAQRDLDAISARFRVAIPHRYAASAAPGWHLLAVPLRRQMLGAAEPALLVIAGAVGLVLLIACVNVANLLLARGAGRAREIAVRVALGARRGRLVRQLLVESAALAAAGGALGTALAWGGVRVLVRLDRGSVPRLDDARVDGATLGFALGASLATGVFFGLFPALRHSQADVRSTLGGARGATAGRAQGRLRAGLVALEVGMATVVLVGAALLGRSFAAVQRVQPGFVPDGVVTAQVTLPSRTYDSLSKVVAFHERLAPQLAALPGVTQASGVFPLPMSREAGWGGSFIREGDPTTGPMPHAELAVALPGYFRTMGVPLVSGRDFTADDRQGTTKVVIVDDVLARRYWPRESPLGKRIDLTGVDDQYATIVGVVAHVRSAGPRAEGEPQIYMPFAQRPERTLYLVVRASAARVPDPASLAPAMRERLRALDPSLPLADVASMDAVTWKAVARERFDTLLLGIFGAAALALAAVGLYGVMAYLVAQRTAEVGIRIALGGRPADVRRLVVRQGVGIAAVGLAAGMLGALALSRSLGALLFEVRPTDPLAYATIAVLLLLVSYAASYVPARRATRIDPVNALRG